MEEWTIVSSSKKRFSFLSSKCSCNFGGNIRSQRNQTTLTKPNSKESNKVRRHTERQALYFCHSETQGSSSNWPFTNFSEYQLQNQNQKSLEQNRGPYELGFRKGLGNENGNIPIETIVIYSPKISTRRCCRSRPFTLSLDAHWLRFYHSIKMAAGEEAAVFVNFWANEIASCPRAFYNILISIQRSFSFFASKFTSFMLIFNTQLYIDLISLSNLTNKIHIKLIHFTQDHG